VKRFLLKNSNYIITLFFLSIFLFILVGTAFHHHDEHEADFHTSAVCELCLNQGNSVASFPIIYVGILFFLVAIRFCDAISLLRFWLSFFQSSRSPPCFILG
tara:strand:- start:475 stop:780 length:306 start_codon:yes stop_codon:yes gene_type:complete